LSGWADVDEVLILRTNKFSLIGNVDDVITTIAKALRPLRAMEKQWRTKRKTLCELSQYLSKRLTGCGATFSVSVLIPVVGFCPICDLLEFDLLFSITFVIVKMPS
jgi:hypothetical protein